MKKTVRVPCMIQEGSLGSKAIKQLESVIQSTYHAHFGTNYKLVFLWMTIPKGRAYLAGKISSASTVQVPVEDGMPSNKRHPFMLEVCAKWQHITGCSKNEIILNSSDFTAANEHFKSLQARFDASKKTWIQTKLMGRLLMGYVRNGYLTTDTNF